MITLITAVPGSGKTLWTLEHLKGLAERENRQVYYSGIPLTDKGKEVLDWVELEEPTDWHKLPPGAITVIDECQRIFPIRKAGTTVPEHVSQFETHRHKGFDIFLITQHPNLLDSHVRRLVGRHVHLLRIFGAKAAQVLSWDGIRDNPNSASAKNECLDKRKFIYPKQVFAWYKSAEMHTHKFQLPKKVWVLLLFVLFAVLAVAASVYFLARIGGDAQDKTEASAPAAEVFGTSLQPEVKVAMTAEQYLASRTPRVPGAPESAPVYDDIRTPNTFPKVSACIASASKCTCYTQQGNPVTDMEDHRCRWYVEKSWFDPYRDDRELLAEREPPQARANVPAPPAARPPITSVGKNEPHQYPGSFGRGSGEGGPAG